MLKRVLAVAAVVSTYLIVTTTSAIADGCPPGQTPSPAPGGGVICIVVTDPGTPDDPANDGPSNPGAPTCHRADGTSVDCVTDWGTWDSAHQCWIHPVDVPQTDPVWDGHADGSIWMCGLITDGVDPVVLFWLPPGAEPGLPDPGQLAQHSLGLLKLKTALVRTADGGHEKLPGDGHETAR